jgi:hypothetical protein
MPVAFRPSERHSFNPATQQHIFRGDPGVTFWAGVGFMTTSVFLFAVVALARQGLVSSDPGAGEPLTLAGFGIVSAWLSVRAFRVGIYVSPGVLRVNNWVRTRTVRSSQIRAINLTMKVTSGGEGPTVWNWFPLVELNDGSTFWMSGLDCGLARSMKKGNQMAQPDKVELVNEVRRLLKVGGS